LVEHFLNGKGDIQGGIADLEDIVSPHIVRRIVASPEEDVGLHNIPHIFQHVIERSRGKIALVGAPEACLAGGIGGEAILSSAAKESTAFGIGTLLVFEVNMGISDLNSFKCLTWLGTSSYLIVDLIHIVIIL
jgi:hypothetical protein